MEMNKDKIVTFRLPKDTWKELSKEAEHKSMKLSEHLRDIILSRKIALHPTELLRAMRWLGLLPKDMTLTSYVKHDLTANKFIQAISDREIGIGSRLGLITDVFEQYGKIEIREDRIQFLLHLMDTPNLLLKTCSSEQFQNIFSDCYYTFQQARKKQRGDT